ncbi:DUF5597 domain-containing protein [Microbacterium barkeri]|uniref:DUF5597 domain-containing protein n=1 Tax=Microbacterium barkeri TaxID=33917 RepID=UPI003F17312C
MRRDEERFARAERDPENLVHGRSTLDALILSVFDARLRDADAAACTALMAHVAEIDHDQTVIAVQVENEVGLLGASRDSSALADAEWAQAVPAERVADLSARGDDVHPHLRELWERQGSPSEGTWAEVFGTDGEAEEVFMAWAFSRYVDAIARAGAAVHPLPEFANAWLGPQSNAPEPGRYPSSGPFRGCSTCGRSARPHSLSSPRHSHRRLRRDTRRVRRRGQPGLRPRGQGRPRAGFHRGRSLQGHRVHLFGIEDLPAGHPLFAAYAVLDALSAEALRAQAEDRIHGFRIGTGEQQQVAIGGFDISIMGPFDTRGIFGTGTGSNAEDKTGYGIILQTGEDEFLVSAASASLSFTREDSVVEIDELREQVLDDGAWVPRRLLNGDERHFMFYGDELRTVRITLLRRSGS